MTIWDKVYPSEESARKAVLADMESVNGEPLDEEDKTFDTRDGILVGYVEKGNLWHIRKATLAS